MKKLIRLSILSFFAFLLLSMLACYTYYDKEIAHLGPQYSGEAIEGIKINNSINNFELNINANKRRLNITTDELIFLRKKKMTHSKKFAEVESDYAAVLCRVGKAQEALVILERLIQKYPQEYNIIANLGTTYELIGENKKAVQYIKKGLEMNKKSLMGSDWIHVKILEAKMAMQQNPNWLRENAILGKEAISILESKNEEKIKQFIQDLGYQIFERTSTQFIQPKEMIIGDLIMFLGDLYKRLEYYKYAIESYKLAEEYTVSKPEVLQTNLAFAEQNKSKDKWQEKAKKESNTKTQETKRSPMFTALLLGALAVLVGSVWFMYFRKG
jgi:tetratricopeptide (TPR) repeat protein